MSSSGIGRKAFTIDQPSEGFVILNSGASLALGTKTQGNDSMAETATPQVTSGQFTSPSDAMAVSAGVTVV